MILCIAVGRGEASGRLHGPVRHPCGAQEGADQGEERRDEVLALLVHAGASQPGQAQVGHRAAQVRAVSQQVHDQLQPSQLRALFVIVDSSHIDLVVQLQSDAVVVVVLANIVQLDEPLVYVRQQQH